MERRRKIFELSYEELRNVLIVNFIKVGIQMTLDDVRVKIAIPDVFRYHGKLWTDVFDNIFSEFAGSNHKNIEKISISVSSFFIKKIRDLYFLNLNNTKEEQKPKKEKLSDTQITYCNLLDYCILYNQFPENINWQLALGHLVGKGHLKLYEGFASEGFAVKEKTARVHVKAWVKENMPHIKARMNKMPLAA